VASAIGNVVPDVVAGTALAPLTGGMSLASMLLAESAIGSVMGGIRPGSVDERIGRAAVGGLASIGGAALSVGAAAGVGSALRLFRNVEGQTLSRIGREAEVAGQTIREAAQPPGNVVPMRGVGAAETPEELIGRTGTEAEEAAVMDVTERAGAEATGGDYEKRLLHAQQLGHVPTIGQGTRSMSPTRLYQAAREYAPGGDIAEARIRANNQGVLVRQAAKAAGDEKWEKIQRFDPGWFSQHEARLGEDFRSVEKRLPAVDHEEYASVLRQIHQDVGAFGSLKGQKIVEQAIKNLEGRIGPVPGSEIMNDRRVLSARLSRFYRNGDIEEGDVLYEALGKLDGLIEKEINRNQYKKGLAEKWATARQQWQILKMIEATGATNPQGEINPATLLRKMTAERSSGGFGKGGPVDTNTPVGELFDTAYINADSQSGVPMTGMRMLLRQGARGGIGALGIGGAASLWD
jgi:hypothetical protein